MKKIISIFIAAVMVLAMIPATFVATSAATEGEWIPVHESTAEVHDESRPLCGYHYTPDGLVTDPADLTNYGCGQIMATRNTYDLTVNNDAANGHVLSLDFTINSYPYEGDHWISISIWSKQGPAQGDGKSEFGEGFFNLIRGEGDGKATSQDCLVFENRWNVYQQTAIDVPMDKEGHEQYSMVLDYEGGSWSLYINDVDISNVTDSEGNGLDDIFATFKDAAYVSIKLHSTQKDDKSASITITNFNGEVPYGDDSALPGENRKVIAPIADPSTVEAGKPALIWDATMTHLRSFDGSGFTFDTTEGSPIVRVTPGNNNPWVTWGIPSKISYSATDFPVLAILTRAVTADSANIFYAAGEVLGSINDCFDNFELFDEEYADEWALGYIDLTGCNKWEGRINNMRVGFNSTDEYGGDKEDGSFDIGFIAMFRTEEDAKAYAKAFVDSLGIEETTTVAEENTTTAADDKTIGENTTTVADDETKAAEKTTTVAENTTTGVVENTTTVAEGATTAEEKKGGCGGFVGGFAILGVVALAGVCFKKKH